MPTSAMRPRIEEGALMQGQADQPLSTPLSICLSVSTTTYIYPSTAFSFLSISLSSHLPSFNLFPISILNYKLSCIMDQVDLMVYFNMARFRSWSYQLKNRLIDRQVDRQRLDGWMDRYYYGKSKGGWLILQNNIIHSLHYAIINSIIFTSNSKTVLTN